MERTPGVMSNYDDDFDDTLCNDVKNIEIRSDSSEEDKEMYQNWRSAVKEKDFETADTLRAALIEKGIL